MSDGGVRLYKAKKISVAHRHDANPCRELAAHADRTDRISEGKHLGLVDRCGEGSCDASACAGGRRQRDWAVAKTCDRPTGALPHEYGFSGPHGRCGVGKLGHGSYRAAGRAPFRSPEPESGLDGMDGPRMRTDPRLLCII